MADELTIIVDGFEDRVPAGTTINQLIDRHQARHKDLILELNGRFVHPRDYDCIELQAGSRVELILPAFGG